MEQIIEAIRTCVRGQEPKVDISDVLRAHRCDALLKKQKNSLETVEQIVNRVAIKERYSACKYFFENITCPYAVIKGAVLSSAVYNDPVLRVSGDIDILIHRRDADEAKRLLRACGFIQGRVTEKGVVPFTRKEILYQTAMSHQMAPFIKETSNKLCPYVNLDVNTDVLWGECEQFVDIDEVLLHRKREMLFDVNIYKLLPEMEFVVLCLHHYKDMNSIYLLSKGSLRLGLFCDIYFYLRNLRPSALRIAELSHRLGVGKYVFVCLAHTLEIFNDSVLEPYINVLQNERDELLLKTFGLSREERKNWGIPLFERLFHPNLPQYMQELLTDADRKKILINEENM